MRTKIFISGGFFGMALMCVNYADLRPVGPAVFFFWLFLYWAIMDIERYRRAAQGTEAGTGETEGLDPKGDGPVRQDAPEVQP